MSLERLRNELIEKLSRSAGRLANASREKILRLLRSGRTLEDLLEELRRGLPLDRETRDALESTFRKAAEELTRARNVLSKTIGAEPLDATTLLAVHNINFADVKKQYSDEFYRGVQRAVLSGEGVTSFTHRLREMNFENAETIANTTFAQFNNAYTFTQAEQMGVETFLYYGPVSEGTRPFCLAHAGEIFTLAEIEKMDNGQGLSVRTSGGGYNCRHEWLAKSVEHGAGSEEQGAKSVVKIGKQTFLLNEASEKKLFSHERVLWYEKEKFGKGIEWQRIAKPLSRTHDGLNPEGENILSDGVWMNRFRQKKTNFESHLEKHGAEFGTTRNAYREAMHALINKTNAELYEDATGYFLHDKRTEHIMILDKQSGRIETFFTRDAKMYPGYFVNKKKLPHTLEHYLGKFL